MASRDLAELLPQVRSIIEKWTQQCLARGVHVLVYCTYRSPEEQDAIYAQGRTKPGPIVTYARAWESWHNFRRAVDAVPLVDGKPTWTWSPVDTAWRVFAEEGEALGLEWGGRWKSLQDRPHLQFTEGLTLAQARAKLKSEGAKDARIPNVPPPAKDGQ